VSFSVTLNEREKKMKGKIGKATIMIAVLLIGMALVATPKIETSGTITPTISNFLSYGHESSGKHLFTNTVLLQQGPPPPANWVLLATDPDEGVGNNLKTIYGQLYSGVVYFQVEFYRTWTTINDIDAGIFMDADQNLGTGLPDGYYPGQNTGIGADYLIIVGYEAPAMFKWDPISGSFDWTNPIPLAYLDAPDYTNVFVVGVYLADVQTTGVIDGAVSDIPSDWDWMPDTGHFTFTLNPSPSRILIVADDDGASYIHGTSLPEFESALIAAGYSYSVWTESIMGNPSLEYLLGFDLVIWTCGDYWDWAVDPTDATTLESYFAYGGRTILEGEDIGYNHGSDNFMVNVAHATMGIDGTGAPGLTVSLSHPVTQGLPTTMPWETPPTIR